MYSELITPNLALARELTERFFNDDKPRLGQDAFYMFSVSKFILLKEKIIKKDSKRKILHFDNVRYKTYIPIILDFYKKILKSGSYTRNNTQIRLTDESISFPAFEDAIWCFNKVRDSLAHGKYSFNFDHQSVVINNVAKDNSYSLKCEIPIDLINSFTFFVEGKIDKVDRKTADKQYLQYIKDMSKYFDVDNNINHNPYIYKYLGYKDCIIKDDKFINNYIQKNTYDNIYNNISSNKYNDSYINNYDNYNTKNISDNEYNNYFNEDLDLYDYKFKKKNTEIKDEFPADNNEILNDKIDEIIYNQILKSSDYELCNLANMLLLIHPENLTEIQKTKTVELLRRVKKLLELSKVEKKGNEYNAMTRSLIREMKHILGIDSSCKNPEGLISLYNYMSLIFSQSDEIDYSKLNLHSMRVEFIPNKDDGGTAVSYSNVVESIRNKCSNFNKKMESSFSSYESNKSRRYKFSLMDVFANFYTEIMKAIGNRNKYVIDSVRNAIEHGNYSPYRNGDIILYDQTDHNDNGTIKFAAATTPTALFDISKQIESSKTSEFLLRDFLQQLTSILGNDLFEQTLQTLNKLSNIVFDKDLDLDYTMENMYHELIVTIVAGKVERDKQV